MTLLPLAFGSRMQDSNACAKENFHPLSLLARREPLHIPIPTGEGLTEDSSHRGFWPDSVV